MSLRLRLTLLTTLLTGGTVLIFAVVFYTVLESNLLSAIDTRLQDRATLLFTTLKATQSDSTSSATVLAYNPLVELDSPGIYTELVGGDGRVRATSPNLPAGYLSQAARAMSANITSIPQIETVTAGGDEQLRLLLTPVIVAGRDDGVLIVAESLEPFQRTLAQAQALLLGCSGLALLLAIIGSTVLTGRALAPVGRLTLAAARIASTGEYQQRVPMPRRRDEVGQLAMTMNELIAVVEQTLLRQRQFIADTSHELRSPLTAVLANLNLLRRVMPAAERDLSISEATAEAQRMRRLVNDLLLLAQADATQVIACAPVQLHELVTAQVAKAGRQAPGYTYRAEIAGPALVHGDAERLTQAIGNLLENARHHTLPGTTITMRVWHEGARIHLSVADTGPGIPAAHLPHIWERFYRVDKARSRTYGGSGLGLAIVKYIVEAHSGAVAVTSVAGQGTTFTISLPSVREVAPIGIFAPASSHS